MTDQRERTDSPVLGPVRVRFAPSPTGFLHVGGARTAIYNELLRQSVGGAAILRIEDTDRERSDNAMTKQITSALDWIGVCFDEGPFLQSERIDRHRKSADTLLEAGKAYRCFCTPDEIQTVREAAEKKGEKFLYPGTCRERAPEQSETKASAGESFVVRFRMPGTVVRFDDIIRGAMEFPAAVLDDFILLRSDGTPTYHLSVVTDDIDMGVTHVIRGEDHLSNTPKHVPLFEALAGSVPMFAHLPLILGPDKKRLSKRTGATSVEEFQAQGILPQALYNYLALLGWYPGDDVEIMSREEMIQRFDARRLNASAAVFDIEKLLWMNGQYLNAMTPEAALPYLEPFLASADLGAVATDDHDRLLELLTLYLVRSRTLAEVAESLRPYFQDDFAYDEADVAKYRLQEGVPAALTQLRQRFAATEDFSIDGLESLLRELATELDVGAGKLIHPLRMAISGVKKGPPVFDVVVAQGRERTDQLLARFEAHMAQAEPVGGAKTES